MAVDYVRPEYEAMENAWKRCRDVIMGQDAVHAAGGTYLPMLSGQSTAEYEAYKIRALFYNATGRTVDGLSGMVFRKPVEVKAPTGLEPMLNDIDMAGSSIHGFAESIIDEVLQVGRAGILVEYPQSAGDGITVGAAQMLGIRPFLVSYKAEQIINWRMGRVNNAQVLTQIIITETIEEEDDGFAASMIDVIREFVLMEGVYVQRVYRQADGKWFQLGDDVFPHKDGQNMTFIPFVFVGVNSSKPEVNKPPLIDLVDVNLSHYRSTADIEHAAHFTALPTAVVTGHRLDNDSALSIGSGDAWVFPEADAKAQYLEYTGAGLSPLSDRLNHKESMMSVLGARMLAADKRAAETAETESIRRVGENSVLASITIAVGISLERALTIMAQWAGITGDISVSLNRDFLPSGISPQKIVALLQAVQSGSISRETFYDNMVQGEVIADGSTFEDEAAKIEADSLGVIDGGE